MKKEDIYNAVSDIRPEYLDEADNFKPSEDLQEKNPESKGNTVTEEYQIKTETHSGRNYVKYAATAAVLLLITGTACFAANAKMNYNNENLSSVSVSETQTSSPAAEPSVSDAADNITDITTSASAVENTVLTEAVSTVSETTAETMNSTIQNNSDDNKEQKTENNESEEKNSPSDTDAPVHIITEKTEVTEAVTQVAPETQMPEVTAEETVKEIHLPNIPYDPSETYLSDEAVTPENFTKILESLSYSPETCDGMPEYSYTADDGTKYYILMSCKHVWRKNKNTGIMEEAQMTDYSYVMTIAYIGLYGLAECSW